MTRKDDGRILVALARGYEVSYHWRGTERPRFGYVTVKHVDRSRTVDKSALLRLLQSGLVESPGLNRPHDYGDWSEPSALTDAGKAAAADMEMDDDVIFAAPRVSSEEQRTAAQAKRTARKVFKVLTFNSGRIRGSQVMFVSGGRLVAGFASAYREPLSEAVMNLVRPHCEEFTDVDDKQSLRITESGIAATARRTR